MMELLALLAPAIALGIILILAMITVYYMDHFME